MFCSQTQAAQAAQAVLRPVHPFRLWLACQSHAPANHCFKCCHRRGKPCIEAPTHRQRVRLWLNKKHRTWHPTSTDSKTRKSPRSPIREIKTLSGRRVEAGGRGVVELLCAALAGGTGGSVAGDSPGTSCTRHHTPHARDIARPLQRNRAKRRVAGVRLFGPRGAWSSALRPVSSAILTHGSSHFSALLHSPKLLQGTLPVTQGMHVS